MDGLPNAPERSSPTSLTLPTSGGGFDLTARNHHVLRTSFGTFHVSTTEGRFGWPAVGSRGWTAELLTDDPGLEEVRDAFGVTEREALDVLARAVRRFGVVGPVAAPRYRAWKWRWPYRGTAAKVPDFQSLTHRRRLARRVGRTVVVSAKSLVPDRPARTFDIVTLPSSLLQLRCSHRRQEVIVNCRPGWLDGRVTCRVERCPQAPQRDGVLVIAALGPARWRCV
jgi:hypothetical protein